MAKRCCKTFITTAIIFVCISTFINYGYMLTHFFWISENLNCTVYKRNSAYSETWFDRNAQQYHLRIIVLTYNRSASLRRLLKSLNEVDYLGDRIKLEIWIDRSKTDSFDGRTVKISSEFQFNHGKCNAFVHANHAGLIGQWLTTWEPIPESQEIAVFLEDDLTVSPHFYKYLKLVHAKYDTYHDINGYALQGVSITHGSSGTLQGPKNSHVFLYPVLGTWGFSPSVTHWIEFTKWFREVNGNNSFNPYIPGNIVTDWYKTFQKQGKEDGMWSIWHAYHSWKNKYYTMYTNFGKNCFYAFQCLMCNRIDLPVMFAHGSSLNRTFRVAQIFYRSDTNLYIGCFKSLIDFSVIHL